jgi:hypothetical protein
MFRLSIKYCHSLLRKQNLLYYRWQGGIMVFQGVRKEIWGAQKVKLQKLKTLSAYFYLMGRWFFLSFGLIFLMWPLIIFFRRKNAFPTSCISFLPLSFSIFPLKKIQNAFFEVFFKGKIGIFRGRKDM